MLVNWRVFEFGNFLSKKRFPSVLTFLIVDGSDLLPKLHQPM